MQWCALDQILTATSLEKKGPPCLPKVRDVWRMVWMQQYHVDYFRSQVQVISIKMVSFMATLNVF